MPRSPIPVIADNHHQYKMALAALEAGVHGLRLNPGNIRRLEHIKAVAQRVPRPQRADPHRGQRWFARSLAVRAVRRDPAGGDGRSALREIAYFDEVGFDLYKISVKASNVPLMVEAYRQLSRGHRRSAAPRRHRGRPTACRVVEATAGLATLLLEGIGDTYPLLADRRPGRGGPRPGASCWKHSGCASARTST